MSSSRDGGVATFAGGISGTVFEDVNYGGGAGRDRTAASGVGRAGARVELYSNSGSSGVFVSSTTTQAGGTYAFTTLAAGSYTVRVVNDSVSSSRTGYLSSLKAVQTFRTDASSGTAVAVTDRVGGQDPAVADAGAASPGATLDTTTGVFTAGISGTAQSITTVTSAGPDITGADFGFNFNTIVNINDLGQGSLRHFILNSNALDNAGLAIQGQPAGQDVSVFMISDGEAHPGLRAGLANQLNGSGVAVITPATALPAITAAATTIDGTTQTANVDNSNPIVLGAGGTVGVDGLALSTVAGPEVEIAGSGAIANGLLIQAGNAIVRGLSIYGFGTASGDAAVRVGTFSDALIENNVLGSLATAFTDPGATRRNQAGVYSAGGSNGIVGNNLIGFARVTGVYLSSGSTGWTVTGNEIRNIGMNSPDGDGITINASPTNTCSGNLITGSSSQGIVATVSGATGNAFTNNTVTGNGVGIASGLAQSTAITIRSGAASTVLDRNVVRANYGAGVQVNNGSTNTQMTRNSFALNGTITARNGSAATGQIGIDLNSASDNADFGTAPFYTLNDAGDADAGGNGLVNFPVLAAATPSGTNLVLTGYARPGSLIELFIANADPSGFGEGETYLLTLTEGGTGAGGTDPYPDTDAGTGSYGPGAINGIAQGADNTNRFAFTFPRPGGVGAGALLTATATLGGATSEFSGLVTVLNSVSGTVFEDVNYGGGAGRNLNASSNEGGSDLSAARVELFDGTGSFVTSTTSDGAGNYTFAGLAAGNYTVRMVSSSVTSSRTGYVAGLLPVQTFRTNASSGTAVDVTDYVGGHDPAMTDAGNAAAGWILNATTGVFSGSGAGKAHAFAPVTVGAASVTGVDFGWNFDTIVNTHDSGQGSLRQFITNANTLGGDASLAQSGRPAGIESALFMISNGTVAPGLRAANNYFVAGIATISPATALPTISTPMILNAQTQPGFDTTPIVRIDGVGIAGPADGLSFSGTSDRSAARGLMLTRFGHDGIVIQANADNVTVAGNWLGTNGSGVTTMRNTNDGLEVFGANATIGGVGANNRNVIVNNGNEGINLSGAAATGNLIIGNYIGLEPDGAGGAGNGDVGIAVLSGANRTTIGGLTAAERNVISMNFEGIEISSTNNVVQGNYFGTDHTGTLNFGQRSSDAVEIITGGTGNVIGGTANGAGNLIAFTKAGRHGVSIEAGSANAVLGNSIHSNTGLGVDLANNGVTANDGAKTVGQPNLLMDHPLFTTAALVGNTLTVSGYVGSAPNQATFADSRVEVFESDNDGTGFGEGKTYLGFLTTNANGNFSGSLDVTGKGLVEGESITGTATDASNNTSEFGPQQTVGGGLAIVKRAFRLDGTPVPTGTVVPAGMPFRFLLYISNPGPAVADVSLKDVLDPAFAYVSGSIRYAGTAPACALPTCTAAEEDTVFAAANSGTVGTDALDGDVVSVAGSTIDAGNEDAANLQLDIPAGKVWAIVFSFRAR